MVLPVLSRQHITILQVTFFLMYQVSGLPAPASRKSTIVVPLTATCSEHLISKKMPHSPHLHGGLQVSVIDEEWFSTPFKTPYENDDAFNQDDNNADLSLARKGTPDCSTGNHHNTKKPLQPLPVISPSTFAPHLPSSSLIKSAAGGDAEQEDEPMSSIEQFDSPDKGSYCTISIDSS